MGKIKEEFGRRLSGAYQKGLGERLGNNQWLF